MNLLPAVVVLAQAETQSNVDLVLPETSELIAGVVAFAIVFYFVWKWAFPAIDKALEDRRKAIGGQLEDAEEAKQEAERLLADYNAQLAETRAKTDEVLEEARARAAAMREDLIAKATAEAEQIVSRARDDATAERARVLAEARGEVANLSIDLAERVVGESLDHDTQIGLVERYIAELEK